MHKREEIIAAIQRCAAKLGRAPSQAEFRKACKISWYQIYKDFRGMRQAVRAAGLEPGPRGGPLDVNALVLDWARVVRELGRLPSRAEYSQRGVHHAGTLHGRIGWSQMSHKFVLLVREFHLEREWADVVEIVVRKFPLLKQLAVSSWQIAKPFTAKDTTEEGQTYHGDTHPSKPTAGLLGAPDTETRRTAEMEWGEVMTMEQEPPPRAPLSQQTTSWPVGGSGAVLHEQGMGMRLGRVVSAALAVQILMATMGSGQTAGSNRQLANGNGQEQNEARRDKTSAAEAGVVDASAAGINACSTLSGRASSSGSAKGSDDQVAHVCSTPSGRQGKVLYGAPLQNSVMSYAPTNEAGVILLFGSLAAGMGFRIERLQAAFPDCKAKREVVPGKWEDVLVEFEYESRNFKEHRHDPRGCDAIVCWRHNWPDCPEWLEVIELCNEVM
jgi:hypothetical protein